MRTPPLINQPIARVPSRDVMDTRACVSWKSSYCRLVCTELTNTLVFFPIQNLIRLHCLQRQQEVPCLPICRQVVLSPPLTVPPLPVPQWQQLEKQTGKLPPCTSPMKRRDF